MAKLAWVGMHVHLRMPWSFQVERKLLGSIQIGLLFPVLLVSRVVSKQRRLIREWVTERG